MTDGDARTQDELDQSLADVLSSVRLETGFISRAILRAPFAVHSTGLPMPIFHAVASGTCCVRRDGDDEHHHHHEHARLDIVRGIEIAPLVPIRAPDEQLGHHRLGEQRHERLDANGAVAEPAAIASRPRPVSGERLGRIDRDEPIVI